MKSITSKVRIVEVGPRDGLQNERTTIPLEAKVGLIEELAEAGLLTIECGAFVSPRWVPQMADTASVFRLVQRRDGVSYTALVPNRHGFEQCAACNVSEIAVFVAASESFSQANLNCSVAEGLSRAEEVASLARAGKVKVRGYVSCVLGCPFSGEIAPRSVGEVARSLFEMGCYEVSLGDTIGAGTPDKVRRLLDTVEAFIPVSSIAVHFHDTWGQALANVLVSLEMGIAVIDSAVSGLGGCPYAPGAAGNLATEDLLYLLHGMGIETGVDLAKVAAAGRKISFALGRKTTSKAAIAIEARLLSETGVPQTTEI